MAVKDVIVDKFLLKDKNAFSKNDERARQKIALKEYIGFTSGTIEGIVKCGVSHPFIEKIRRAELKKMRDAGQLYNSQEFAAITKPQIDAHLAIPGYGVKGDLPDISFVVSEITDVETKIGAIILYDIRIVSNEKIKGVTTVTFECTPMPAIEGFGTDLQWGVTMARIYSGLLNHIFENTDDTGLGILSAIVFPVVNLPTIDWSWNPLYIDELNRLGLNFTTVPTVQGDQQVDYVNRITL